MFWWVWESCRGARSVYVSLGVAGRATGGSRRCEAAVEATADEKRSRRGREGPQQGEIWWGGRALTEGRIRPQGEALSWCATGGSKSRGTHEHEPGPERRSDHVQITTKTWDPTRTTTANLDLTDRSRGQVAATRTRRATGMPQREEGPPATPCSQSRFAAIAWPRKAQWATLCCKTCR